MFGISPDTPESHFAFGCRLDLQFPLLADTKKEVAHDYNVKSRLTGYGRAVFIVDVQGIVRDVLRPAVGGLLSYPAVDAIEKSLATIQV